MHISNYHQYPQAAFLGSNRRVNIQETQKQNSYTELAHPSRPVKCLVYKPIYYTLKLHLNEKITRIL